MLIGDKTKLYMYKVLVVTIFYMHIQHYTTDINITTYGILCLIN